MPRLRRSSDQLVFLVNIAAPGSVLLVPLLGATALAGFFLYATLRVYLAGAMPQPNAAHLPEVAIATAVILVALLVVDLFLLGTIYVFDRAADQISAYRGPLRIDRFVLSDLLDVEVNVTTDRHGVDVALGALLFRSHPPFRLNVMATGSVGVLLAFQREVREFVPILAAPATGGGALAPATAKPDALAAAPQFFSALLRTQGAAAITHPEEALKSFVHYLEEHAANPEVRDLMKTLEGLRQDPASAALVFEQMAERQRQRGDVEGATRIDEAARRLRATIGPDGGS